MSKRTGLIAVLAASTLILTGCAPGGSGAATSTQAAVKTDPAQIGKATITVMDAWPDKTSPDSRWLAAVEASFMKKYPNITVKRQTGSYNDINTTLRLKLSDPSVPDIVPANNGWQGIGELSKAHLVLNLDSYASAYGWRQRIPSTILRQHEVTTDGKHIGTGAMFGMPIAQGGLIAIYYNRAKLASLGLSVPTTFAQFEGDLAKAKAAGETPLQTGSQDQAQADALLYALQDVYGNAKDIGDFIYGSGKLPLSKTGMLEAATTLQKWNKDGYFPPDVAAVSSGDSAQKFVDGNGVFDCFFSDALPFKDEAESNKFGMFMLPPVHGSVYTGTGATQQNLSIAANSKHPDAAALFLNYISSTAAGNEAVNVDITPLLGTYKAGANRPMARDELASLDKLQKSNGFVPYFDWSTPTMLSSIGAQAQLLLASRATPDQAVQALQTDYDSFKAKQ